MLHFNLSWFVFLLNTVILKAVISIQEKYLNRHFVLPKRWSGMLLES